MTLDMGNTDKLRNSAQGRPPRHQDRAAVGQPLRRRVRCRRQHHPLRAGGLEGRRPRRSRPSSRPRRQAIHGPDRLCQPHKSARRQQARPGKPRRLRRLRPFDPAGRGRMPRSTRCSRPPQPRTRPRPSARTTCSAARRTARPSDPGGRSLAVGRQAAARIRRHRLLPVGPSARRYAPLLKKMNVQSWVEFSRAVKSARPPDGSPQPSCRGWSGAPRPATRWASRPVRSVGPLRGDPVRRRAAAYRDISSGFAGAAVLSAEAQGDEVRARIQSASRSTGRGQAAEGAPRVPAGSGADRRSPGGWKNKGDGEVTSCCNSAAGPRSSQAARPLQGLAADRRRDQGGAGVLDVRLM